MGEEPLRVITVGAPGLEYYAHTEKWSPKKVEESLGDFSFGARTFVVTYHPVTLQPKNIASEITELLAACDAFPDANFIFTGHNADPGGSIIGRHMADYQAKNSERVRCYESLGQARYVNVLRHADAVLGNSSSGIIEAPFVGIPTVNIGDRQKGRLMAESIFCSTAKRDSIEKAMQQALNYTFPSSPVSLYGSGATSQKIVSVLEKTDFSALLQKRFCDLAL